MITRSLGRSGLMVSQLGLGLAAVGRPAYITLGRSIDLPPVRSEDAMFARAAELLDAAVDAGVRYVDVARSYGQAEVFLARWLAARGLRRGVLTVGSKWGYAYTGDWQLAAAVHEQKELSVTRFAQQAAESRAVLGPWLDLYQIHSATAESGCLTDAPLLRALVRGRRRGWYRAVGLTLTGSSGGVALEQALEASVDGERIFDVVQATFNVLEPSLAPALAAAHAAGLGVIVKEAHANGRLTPANDRPADRAWLERLTEVARAHDLTVDQLALAFVVACPWVDCVLSGAATTAQLASHRAAIDAALPAAIIESLSSFAEAPGAYWASRASLHWL